MDSMLNASDKPETSKKRKKSKSTSNTKSEKSTKVPPFQASQTSNASNISHSFTAPVELQEHIYSVHDVGSDGNCGFRAIAMHVYGDENCWMMVRRDLIDEMVDYKELYIELVGIERYNDLIGCLHIEHHGGVPPAKWFSSPDMCHAVASKYNFAFVSIASQPASNKNNNLRQAATDPVGQVSSPAAPQPDAHAGPAPPLPHDARDHPQRAPHLVQPAVEDPGSEPAPPAPTHPPMSNHPRHPPPTYEMMGPTVLELGVSPELLAAEDVAARQLGPELVTAHQVSPELLAAEQVAARQLGPELVTARRVSPDLLTARRVSPDLVTADPVAPPSR
ncbi:hypothetical protein RIF29_32321 [Crotalaria pallida]|uniref:OTU domain-containing protein n=1 Tax=Crotalaria pallida TaxID=3830 RepID=A0AAN9ENB0_CROPI